MPTTPGCQLARAEDDHRVAGGVESLRFELFERLVADLQLEELAFLVVAFEAGGQFGGQPAAVGEQGLERVERVVHAPGGVDPRAEPEADVHAGGVAVEAGEFLQGAQSGVEGAGQAAQSLAHQDAVFPDQRHDVGDGGQGDEFQQPAQIEVFQRPALEHRVGELEGDAGGAQVGEVLVGGGRLRVDEGAAVRPAVGSRFMVVDHHHVDALGLEAGDFLAGGGAAVHGEQQVGFRALAHAAFERGLVEAVAFAAADRNEMARLGAVGLEDAPAERDRGDAVDVVVAEDADLLVRDRWRRRRARRRLPSRESGTGRRGRASFGLRKRVDFVRHRGCPAVRAGAAGSAEASVAAIAVGWQRMLGKNPFGRDAPACGRGGETRGGRGRGDKKHS